MHILEVYSLENSCAQVSAHLLDITSKVQHTHTQVSLEERQLLKLSGSNSIPEVEEAQKEIVQLQNELKVRTKLNKLQSSKVQPMLILYIGENYILKILWLLQQYIFGCLSCICISKESYQIHQFF